MLSEMAARMQKGLDRHQFDKSVKFDCGDAGCITLIGGQAKLEDVDADCTIRISQANLEKLMAGKLNPMTAFAMGKIKLSGDSSIALKLGKLLG